MHLNHVAVKNYRGKSFDFVPGNVNLFFGRNGQGKTSLCDAIRFGITGQLPKDDVRNMTVSIEFTPGFTITRSRGKNTLCQINDKRVTEKALNEAIEDALGIPLESVKISSGSDIILNLKPKEFMAFLVRYIPEKLDFDTVSKYFTNPTDDILNAARELFPAGEFDIEELSRAYDKAYEIRRDVNSRVRMKASEIQGIGTLQAPARTMEEIDADIAEMAVRMKELSTQTEKIRAYTDAVNRKAKQEAEIAELRKKMDELNPEHPGEPPEDVPEGAEEAYKNREAEIDRLTVDRDSTLRMTRNNVALFKKTLEGLNTQRCPLSDKLVCTTDKSGIRSELEQAVRDNEDAMAKLEAEIRKLKAEREACEKTIGDIEQKRKTFKDYAQYKSRLDIYLANAVEVPPRPEVQMNAEEIRKRNGALAAEKKNLEDFNRKRRLTAELESLRKQADDYNYIVTALSDKGEVKSAIISYYLNMFEQVCNGRASGFAQGYSVKFEQCDGIVVLVKTPGNDDYYPLTSLSRGETIIASFILMDMLNQLSNSRLLFLDNVEALDEESLTALRNLLDTDEFMDAYDHAFICGVNHDSVVKVFDSMLASWI